MTTGGKRKTKHILTEDETAFNRELSTELYNLRSASGMSINEMAKRTGYSEVHLRKLENFDEGPVTTIPAYIMAVYAKACNAKMEDLCEGWLNKMEKPLKKNAHAKRIKNVSVGENDLIQRMRVFKIIGSSQISQLLGSLTRQDLETIYCLKNLEEKHVYHGLIIGNSIRHMIYDFYMRIGNDSQSGYKNIKPI